MTGTVTNRKKAFISISSNNRLLFMPAFTRAFLFRISPSGEISYYIKNKTPNFSRFHKRREPDLNRRWRCCRPGPYHLAITPYYIVCKPVLHDDSNGNRTRVTAVKGRCLNRLTMGPHLFDSLISNMKNSPSRARTYNNSVNSRVLYHWAIEDY